MNFNEDEDLKITNENFQETYDILDNNKCVLNLNNIEKVKLKLPLCEDGGSPSYFIPDCFKENEENRNLEVELVEIENDFQNICSKYTFFRNPIFEEKLTKLNNMKMNKSHATENKHLNHNQEDKTFVYDFVKT